MAADYHTATAFNSNIAIATAFIASRVDYCNAVLYGVSAKVTRRLQMVLNAAARLVVSTGKYDHITPALRDVLHWLPVPQRTEFKIAVLAFDCVRGTGPAYTSKMSACRCRILLLGALSVRLSVVTYLFLEQERRSSVDGVSRWHSGRLEFTTGSLTITTDKSRTVSGWA